MRKILFSFLFIVVSVFTISNNASAKVDLFYVANDNILDSSRPNDTKTCSIYGDIGSWNNYGGAAYRYISKLNLSNVNVSSAEITKALFKIDRVSTTWDDDDNYILHKITSDWDPNSVTWNNPPSFDSASIPGQKGGYGIFEFDITNIVKGWVDNPSSNYGFLIKKINEDLNASRHKGSFACANYGTGGSEDAPILEIHSSEIAQDSIQFHNIKIDGDNLVVSYSKNFATCAHLKKSNHSLVHTNNFFCQQGNNIEITQPLSKFTVFEGQELMLCHGNNGNICSEFRSVEKIEAVEQNLIISDIRGNVDSGQNKASIYWTTGSIKGECTVAYSKNSNLSSGTTILGSIIQYPTSTNDGKYHYYASLNNLADSDYYYKIMCVGSNGASAESSIYTLKSQTKPDLTINSLSVKENGNKIFSRNPNSGERFYLQPVVSFGESGEIADSIPAGTSFLLDFYVNNVKKGTSVFTKNCSSCTGYSLENLFPLTINSNGNFELKIVTDTQNIIAESNENNNIFITTITIGTAQPEINILDVRKTEMNSHEATIQWRSNATKKCDLIYSSKDSNLEDDVIYSGRDQNDIISMGIPKGNGLYEAGINIQEGNTYYYKVVCRNTDNSKAISSVYSFNVLSVSKPDLVIKDINNLKYFEGYHSSIGRSVRKGIHGMIEISNIGNVNAILPLPSQQINMLISFDSIPGYEQSYHGNIGLIRPGATEIFSIAFELSEEAETKLEQGYSFTVKIDPENSLSESNENNNTFTKIISTAVTTQCTDTDGGKNYYTKGTSNTFSDYCIDNNTLREFYCEGNESKTISYKCPGNCQNGVCIDTQITKPKPENLGQSIKEINQRAKDLLGENKLDSILAELKQLRSLVKEQQTQIKHLKKLVQNVKEISEQAQSAISNFITYGVDENTKKLGEGERAAVMFSYKSAFDKLPETEEELADAIKIANGRWPSMTNDKAEKGAKVQFKKIYKRDADMNDPNDNAAVTVMAYGLRQKAENRNLNSEKQGIRTFEHIYGYHPSSTEDWNIMQAITYSGATR